MLFAVVLILSDRLVCFFASIRLLPSSLSDFFFIYVRNVLLQCVVSFSFFAVLFALISFNRHIPISFLFSV